MLSICDSDSYKYYTYKIQVRNNGDATAEDVKLSIKLPFDFEQVYIDSIEMGTYQYNHHQNERNTRLDTVVPNFTYNIIDNNSINFSFPGANLPNCKKKLGPKKANGYIIFTVKRGTSDTRERVEDVIFDEAGSEMSADGSNFKQFTITDFYTEVLRERNTHGKIATIKTRLKYTKNSPNQDIIATGCQEGYIRLGITFMDHWPSLIAIIILALLASLLYYNFMSKRKHKKHKK